MSLSKIPDNASTDQVGLMYWLFILIVFFEYMGVVNHYLPFLRGLPLLLGLSFLLFLYAVAKNTIGDIVSYRQTKYMIFFIILTILGVAHGFLAVKAYDVFKVQFGYFLLFMIAFYLTDNIKKLELFALVFASIHFILIIVNLDLLTSGVRVGYFKAGYFMGDGNDFSWSLVIAYPFALYFLLNSTIGKFKKLYSLACVTGILFGIFGAQSRGAALGLVCGLLYYWAFVSRKKIAGIIVLGMVLLGAILFAPTTYFDRMGTITTYEEDTSAMGRIMAWKSSMEMAIDNPVLGVGAGSFNSVYGRYYRSDDAFSPRWISTHSVYFRILAEYSFLGLFVFVYVLYFTFKQNYRLKQLVVENEGRLHRYKHWPTIMNMVIIGYSVCAVFLSGVEYPHYYLIIALSMALDRMIRIDLSEEEPLY